MISRPAHRRLQALILCSSLQKDGAAKLISTREVEMGWISLITLPPRPKLDRTILTKKDILNTYITLRITPLLPNAKKWTVLYCAVDSGGRVLLGYTDNEQAKPLSPYLLQLYSDFGMRTGVDSLTAFAPFRNH